MEIQTCERNPPPTPCPSRPHLVGSLASGQKSQCECLEPQGLWGDFGPHALCVTSFFASGRRGQKSALMLAEQGAWLGFMRKAEIRSHQSGCIICLSMR